MALVKVRHALISWVDEGSKRVLTAFRGQHVDLPEAEIARLRPHGAIVSADAELERPGSLLELPQSPTDEELINWVLSASPTEIAQLAHERPELAPRIDGAVLHITDERALQDQHLASVREALNGISSGQQLGPGEDATILPVVGETGTPRQPATGGSDEEPPLPGAPAPGVGNDDIIMAATGGPAAATGGGESPVPPPLAPTDVVKGSPEQVSAYLSQHPELAQAVLDAETAATNGQPREAVVAAANAAAAFATS